MTKLKQKNGIILLGLYSQLFISNPILADAILKTIDEKKNSIINRNAIELSIGKFHPGPYAPYQMSKKKWNSCNTLNICDLSNLCGNNVAL